MYVNKSLDIFDFRLRPDFTVRPSDIWELLLLIDLRKIRYRRWPNLPLTSNCSRMVSAQKLIAADSMSTNQCSTTEFCNPGTTSQSPKSNIAQAHNEIRIMGKQFVAKPFEFKSEFSSDVSRFSEGGVAID